MKYKRRWRVRTCFSLWCGWDLIALCLYLTPFESGVTARNHRPLHPCKPVICMCMWLFGRRGGDLIVIEMQSHNDQLRGRVTAVLSPPGCSSLGWAHFLSSIIKSPPNMMWDFVQSLLIYIFAAYSSHIKPQLWVGSARCRSHSFTVFKLAAADS